MCRCRSATASSVSTPCRWSTPAVACWAPTALPGVDAGGGLLVADADLTPQVVAETVIGLVDDPARLAAMTAAAAGVGHRDAAAQVAQVGLELAARRRAERSGR